MSTSVNFEVLVVSLISGLTVTKSANKMVWADGTLTFTIGVDNQTEKLYGPSYYRCFGYKFSKFCSW